MNENIDVVTTEEMTDFIEGLFETTEPKPDPNWNLITPTIDSVKDSGVEFATEKEVTGFISGLFKKS